MMKICSAIAISPKMNRRVLCSWKALVKSPSGVTTKSCHFLPNDAGSVVRLAT